MTQQQRIWAAMALLCLGGIVFYFFLQKQATQKHLRNYYQLHLQQENSFGLISTSIDNTMAAFTAKIEKEKRGEEFLERSEKAREMCYWAYEQIAALQNQMLDDGNIHRDIECKPLKSIVQKALFQNGGLDSLQVKIDSLHQYLKILEMREYVKIPQPPFIQKFSRDSLQINLPVSRALQNHFKNLSLAAAHASLSSIMLAIQHIEKMAVDINYGKIGEETILFDRTPTVESATPNDKNTYSNAGNGNYSYIDDIKEAEKVLQQEIGGTLFTIAKDVKLQIEFNPQQVKSYRLVGYENRLLQSKDFDNDKVGAGDMGVGHTVTAFYEIIRANPTSFTPKSLKYQKTELVDSDSLLDEWGTISIRYKHPKEGISQLFTHIFAAPKSLTEPSDNFTFAAAVIEYGLWLRDSQYKGTTSLDGVIDLAKSAKIGKDGYKKEFLGLLGKSRLLESFEGTY